MKNKIFVILILLLVGLCSFDFRKDNKKFVVKKSEYHNQLVYTASNYLKKFANDDSVTNYADGNIHQMYTFRHDSNHFNRSLTDYRFIGDEPYNYVYFNCANDNDVSTCEIWRILGIFSIATTDKYDGTYEERIKIVSNDSIGEDAYDEDGTSNWALSSLNDYLNNEYYNSLSTSSKQMISTSPYYLGSIKPTDNLSGADYYTKERSYYFYNQFSTYATSWTGKIALMYPSDYVYAYALGYSDNSFNNPRDNHYLNWIHESNSSNNFEILLNRINNNNDKDYLNINPDGTIGYRIATEKGSFRPTLYLRNDIVIKSGDGSIEHPYQFELKSKYIQDKFEYNVGDLILYNNEIYRVLDYSSKDSDYVTVLKDEPLLEKYTDVYNETAFGLTPYYESSDCYYKVPGVVSNRDCKTDYDSSIAKKIVDNWAKAELNMDDLVEVNGYKVRLIKQNEIIENLHFTSRISVSFETMYDKTEQTPAFVNVLETWIMDAYDDGNSVYRLSYSASPLKVYFRSGINPVINLKKEVISDKKLYDIGDEITYRNNTYYVISNSSVDMDYVTVIKYNPLSKKEIIDYGGIGNVIGNIKYYDCNDANCSFSYDISNVKKVIDNWVKYNFDKDDLVEIDGYKARLLKLDEVLNNWNYDITLHDFQIINGIQLPRWLVSYEYPLMDIHDNNQAYLIRNNFITSVSIIDPSTSNYVVRPVVNLKKSAINKIKDNYVPPIIQVEKPKCTPKYRKEKNLKYNEFKHFQEVIYKDEKYYVIEDSGSDKNYVTLLKDKFLTYDDITEAGILKKTTFDESDVVGNIEFLKNDNCYISGDYSVSYGCDNDYSKSTIKRIIDNWVDFEFDKNDLKKVDGYEARLINRDDLVNLGFSEDSITTMYLMNANNDLEWLYNDQYAYWTMINWKDSSTDNFIISNDGFLDHRTINTIGGIRPVIYLKKSSIDNKTDYRIGDKVNYKDYSYYVIENSDDSKDYVILLKETPLDQNRVDYYKKTNFIFLENYFFNDTCSSIDNVSGCINDYNQSNVKKVVDAWANYKFESDDLVEVDGYKARLLTINDLFEKLYYSYGLNTSQDAFKVNDNVPEWVYNNNISYWTMSGAEDFNDKVYTIFESGNIGYRAYDNAHPEVYSSHAIRPVVNVNKCAIEGGCIEEEYDVLDGCLEDEESLVNVDSTGRLISKIVIVISLVLFITGVAFFLYSYYVSKKERKKV